MQIRKTSALVSLLAAAGVAAAMGATPASAVQHHPAPLKHGLGLNVAGLKAAKAAKHAHANSALPVHPLGAAKAPASADLTQYANDPGDQGQVGSCVTWATGYTGYGVLMNEQGITGGPMAPMFIYSQIAKGNDQGTWASVALPMEQKQGIDTKSDYWQGDFDYTTQPDQNEKANAAHYKLSGYTELPTSGSAAKSGIENAISQGEPVAIGFTVHQSFMDLNSSTASD